MATPDTFGWTDIDDISIALYETFPDLDPLQITFPQLREMVENLQGFVPEEGKSVNEQILEAIQVGWHEEKMDAIGNDDDDNHQTYSPNNPFRD